jgi:multisubunit Na+/H+ antiporter MnhC subunit
VGHADAAQHDPHGDRFLADRHRRAHGDGTGRTAPIVDAAVPVAEAAQRVVDPVPSALVLTAIVIGLGVTAVMLSVIVRLHRARGTLMIDECTESKG